MQKIRQLLQVSGLTPAMRWLRTSRSGHGAVLAGLVATWLILYRINESLWETVLFGWLGLAPEERLSETLRFFFYDSVKIALLLSGIIFVVTVMRSYLSVERTRALLAGRREGIGNVLAGLLGVITPFCSCSAVPAFIGFLAAGIPLGVTMSFLIASPLINEVAIGPNSTLTARGNDTLITSNVKARFVDAGRFSAHNVKVVTEAGTVFLLGLVTQAEANSAVQVARTTSGVKKVVNLIEVITPAKARELDVAQKGSGNAPPPAPVEQR